MPRPGLRLLGIAALCALTACSALNEAQAPLPAASGSPGVATSAALSWTENLAFSGDLSGQLTSIVANAPGQTSECTGVRSTGPGEWDSAIYGQVGQAIVGVIVTATPYRGPGVYSAPAASVQVHTADNRRVWRSSGSDAVTFAVASDQESGSLDALLTNQVDNTSKLHVTGTWSCGR